MLGTGLTNLVATVYEAACDPARIVPFVEDAASYFGAQRAAFVVWPVDNPDIFLPVTFGVAEQEIRRLFAERHEPDSLFWKLARETPGTTFLSATQLSDGIALQALAGQVDAGIKNCCGLIMLRDTEHDTFSQSAQESLETLLSYFRRSLLINRRFVRMFAQNNTTLAVLEHTPCGIALFGQRGQLTFQNAEARRIFANSDSFRVDDDVLELVDQTSHERLYAFLQRSRETRCEGVGDARFSARVPRGPDEPALQIIVYGMPFKSTRAAFDDHETLAIMLIHDPSSVMALNRDLLQDFYGFTAAEANLAHSLHSGQTLGDAAEQLKISVNTARTQLRSMFKKAGVNTQASLLREFSTSPRLNIGR